MSCQDLLCPCTSGKLYSACCQSFHAGKFPGTAQELMRSRYSAYALFLAAYIIETTHPANSQYNSDTAQWSQEILAFCTQTEFRKLDILDFQQQGDSATVTFRAHLFQNKQDVSFTEKSTFEKVQGKWLYLSGEFI